MSAKRERGFFFTFESQLKLRLGADKALFLLCYGWMERRHLPASRIQRIYSDALRAVGI